MVPAPDAPILARLTLGNHHAILCVEVVPMLKHCGRCRMTTAFVDGACQRCRFQVAHGLRKPMPGEVKEKLHALNDWRRGKRTTDPRVETQG